MKKVIHPKLISGINKSCVEKVNICTLYYFVHGNETTYVPIKVIVYTLNWFQALLRRKSCVEKVNICTLNYYETSYPWVPNSRGGGGRLIIYPPPWKILQFLKFGEGGWVVIKWGRVIFKIVLLLMQFSFSSVKNTHYFK